jgi:hypothetical protein
MPPAWLTLTVTLMICYATIVALRAAPRPQLVVILRRKLRRGLLRGLLRSGEASFFFECRFNPPDECRTDAAQEDRNDCSSSDYPSVASIRCQRGSWPRRSAGDRLLPVGRWFESGPANNHIALI